MPLTASSNDKDIVFACDMEEDDRASKFYFCRHCGVEMRLVLPEKDIIKHFRHTASGECNWASESPKHLEAKQFFYDMYKNNPLYKSVDMESPWNGLEKDRIGDVVLYPTVKNVHPTVIEVQNSRISTDEIVDRFNEIIGSFVAPPTVNILPGSVLSIPNFVVMCTILGSPIVNA